MSSLLARAPASSAVSRSTACRRQAVLLRAPVRSAFLGPRNQTASQRASPIVRAEAEDFDAVLAKLADKFEKADNKPIIVAYIAGGVGALWFSEWLIHLPVFNFLLGFPIQLLGLLALPYLGIRYLADGESAQKDLEAYTGKITEKLPGLKD